MWYIYRAMCLIVFLKREYVRRDCLLVDGLWGKEIWIKSVWTTEEIMMTININGNATHSLVLLCFSGFFFFLNFLQDFKVFFLPPDSWIWCLSIYPLHSSSANLPIGSKGSVVFKWVTDSSQYLKPCKAVFFLWVLISLRACMLGYCIPSTIIANT